MPATSLRFPLGRKIIRLCADSAVYAAQWISRFPQGATGPAENSQASFVTGRPRKKENPARTILRDETQKFDRSLPRHHHHHHHHHEKQTTEPRWTGEVPAIPRSSFLLSRSSFPVPRYTYTHPTRFLQLSQQKFQRVASTSDLRRYFFAISWPRKRLLTPPVVIRQTGEITRRFHRYNDYLSARAHTGGFSKATTIIITPPLRGNNRDNVITEAECGRTCDACNCDRRLSTSSGCTAST